MADKKYKLKFKMTDGTEQSVIFAIPIPDKDEIIAEVLAELNKPKLISFSIQGRPHQAEQGMTWGDWVNSEYNTNDYQIGADNWIYWGDPDDSAYPTAGADEPLYTTDVIIADYDYDISC